MATIYQDYRNSLTSTVIKLADENEKLLDEQIKTKGPFDLKVTLPTQNRFLIGLVVDELDKRYKQTGWTQLKIEMISTSGVHLKMI